MNAVKHKGGENHIFENVWFLKKCLMQQIIVHNCKRLGYRGK